jgi:hypothetical protein
MGAPTWVIDPIDHTRHFARGDPNYGTLIALVSEGVAYVGVVSAPSLGFRWWAIRGGGSWVNGATMSVSSTDRIEDAHLAIAGHREWVGRYNWTATERLMNDVAYPSGTEGGFLPAMKVASAQLDAFAEPWGELWDHAAVALIVEEAGGRATTFDGGIAQGGTLLVSNRRLHDHLLRYFEDIKGIGDVPQYLHLMQEGLASGDPHVGVVPRRASLGLLPRRGQGPIDQCVIQPSPVPTQALDGLCHRVQLSRPLRIDQDAQRAGEGDSASASHPPGLGIVKYDGRAGQVDRQLNYRRLPDVQLAG